jgi:electron transfer DM13
MSHRTTLSAALLLACTVASAPLAAQQDTSMMQHDSTMMQHDSTMKDQGAMSHEQMMGHDSAMGMDKGIDKGANMMFMGAAGEKAAGDYAITEAGGRQRLTLTDDFSVASGSDLYLVLANGDAPDKGAFWLGKLRHATGAQAYDLPKGKDLGTFTKLLVWSKKEKRAVAAADWHPAGDGAMGHM